MEHGASALTEGEIERRLDGPLSSYSCYRAGCVVLLAQTWAYTTTVCFIDTFAGAPVHAQHCECSEPLEIHPDVLLQEVCTDCAALGGTMTCADHSTFAATFGLYCDRVWMRSLVPNIYFVGLATGSAIASAGLADRVGRRAVVVGASAVVGVVFPLSALAPSLTVYLAAKFIIGTFVMMGLIAGYTLVCELVGTALRTRASSELGCYFQAVHSVLLALAAYALRAASWRTQVVAVAWPYTVFAIATLILPESPFYLLAKARYADAEAVLSRVIGSSAATGGREKHGVTEDKQRLRPGDSQQQQPDSSADEPAGAPPASAAPPPLFTPVHVGVVTGSNMLIWLTTALSFYALSFNTENMQGPVQLNFLYLSLPLFLSAYAFRLCDSRLGRQGAGAVFLGLTAVSLGAGAFLGPSAALGASIIGNFAAAAEFNLIYLHAQARHRAQHVPTSPSLCTVGVE